MKLENEVKCASADYTLLCSSRGVRESLAAGVRFPQPNSSNELKEPTEPSFCHSKEYVAGDVPCQEDCTLFCLSCMVLCNSPRNSAYKAAVEEKFGNILRHARYRIDEHPIGCISVDLQFVSTEEASHLFL